MLFPPLLAPPVFAIRAEAMPSAAHLRLKLSVRNVSPTPQKLWLAATGKGCTQHRWSSGDPSIQVEPYVDATKVCWAACEHFRVLRPGETFSAVYEPPLYRRKRLLVKGKPQEYGVRPGPTVLKFTLAQPNPATIGDTTLPGIRKVPSALFHEPADSPDAQARLAAVKKGNGRLGVAVARPLVLFVAPRNNLYGASRSMLDLVRGLPPRGIDVHVALQTPGPLGDLLDADGIPWTPIRTHRWIGKPRGPLRRLRNHVFDGLTARRLGALAKAKGAALVHTNTLSSPVGARIAQAAGLPHVWHMREAVDTEPGSVFSDGEDAARRFIDSTTARVFCVSHALAEETARYADAAKIRVLHNGPLSTTPAPLPERPPLDLKGEIRLLTVGALGPRKGQEEAIRALALLRKSGLDARLLVAGDGPDAPLHAVAAALGVDSAVELLGYVDPKPLYATSHVSLVLGPRDPLPRVAIESLAQGIPTVGLRSGGIPEVIDDSETGWLYDGSPEALAASVETAIQQSPPTGKRMSEEGWRRVHARFNGERYRDDCVALYRELGVVP